MHSIWTGWWYNPTFWAIFCGWMLAQVTKTICFFVRVRKIDFGFLVSTGGMPSAHSSLAAALCTSVAIRMGTADPLFAVTLAFAAIVMFDAQSVRRAAGQQARVLNKMLDELPQLWNVLKGEMSLVGPRPERPCFVEQFKEEISRYMWRHASKPGLTGWAQVSGLRGNTDIRERIKYDLYYLENWSLAFDFKILVKTLFSRENAY